MDSIENGATIRIWFQNYYKDIDNIPYDFKVPTYSLKIDKKSVLISKWSALNSRWSTLDNRWPWPSDHYLNIYENAAKEIAQIMNKKQVKDYVIYNGERVRISNNAWASCEYIPKDGEEIFRKTLIDCLNWIQ